MRFCVCPSSPRISTLKVATKSTSGEFDVLADEIRWIAAIHNAALPLYLLGARQLEMLPTDGRHYSVIEGVGTVWTGAAKRFMVAVGALMVDQMRFSTKRCSKISI